MTSWRFGLFLALVLAVPLRGYAEPSVRVVAFTANWCPTCQVLDPRIQAAIRASAPDRIVLSEFDFSDAKRDNSNQLNRENAERALAWKIEDIWNSYKGRIGFAVITALDTGETLGCLSPRMTAERMRQRLELAVRMSTETPQGSRKSIGEDCAEFRSG